MSLSETNMRDAPSSERIVKRVVVAGGGLARIIGGYELGANYRRGDF